MANEGWETFLSYEDTRQVFWNASLSLSSPTWVYMHAFNHFPTLTLASFCACHLPKKNHSVLVTFKYGWLLGIEYKLLNDFDAV